MRPPREQLQKMTVIFLSFTDMTKWQTVLLKWNFIIFAINRNMFFGGRKVKELKQTLTGKSTCRALRALVNVVK